MKQSQVTRGLMLLSAAVLLAPSVLAQQAADPFAARHVELMRAAQAQLERLQGRPDLPTTPPLPPRSTLPREGAPQTPLAAIGAARVERARKQLLHVGVDAERIFAEEGVPPQLLVIAEVESGFDLAALSAKGALGLWQLMPDTARRFGLRVDEKVDERLHPARATRAAARYLRELFLLFGDWRLALAGYNAGEQRVNDALAKVSSREFAPVSDHLPLETRRYVPAVFGADVPFRARPQPLGRRRK